MNAECPICKAQHCRSTMTCTICDFTDSMGIAREFVTYEEAHHHFEATIKPYRQIWKLRKREADLLVKILQHEKTIDSLRKGDVSESLFRTQTDINTGETVCFGGFNWRMLGIQDDAALLILEQIWDERPYHRELAKVTWEECSLRRELNDEFYNKIPQLDQSRIFKTSTDDYVFILDVAEVLWGFGDSGKREFFSISDQHNSARIAKKTDGTDFWWWLRSPAYGKMGDSRFADIRAKHTGGRADAVHFSGGIYFHAKEVTCRGGVRPALWLDLLSSRIVKHL